MRELDGRIFLSASDLMRFMSCPHATSLDLAHTRGTGPEPREDTKDAALLQKRGDAHEAAHLADLKDAGRSVVEIERGGLGSNAEVTRAALAAGPDVVFQGAFSSGNWGGWSDFLERVEAPSALGAFSYEVADTKLKRRADPKHVLQLVLYSDLLAEIQGVAPEFAHVELGDGTRATLRLADYSAYARMARQRLEAFVADPKPTRPMPCADCGLCRWADQCASVWQGEDSLFNVANISRGQVKKLEAAGVNMLEALSTLDHPIRGMAENTQARLVTQARLQQARKTGEPDFELRAREPGKGFDLLPEPQPGDLFYDIEGDPHYAGGLEYLHGIYFDGQFQAFWAHDHNAEAHALSNLLAFFRARITYQKRFFPTCYGSCYISGDPAKWLGNQKMDHVRGAPFHPQTQGKIERWHQTMKNRVLLENYYLPSDLERQIGTFVDYYNNQRYHESLSNVTPADVYFGRDKAVLREMETIKKLTIRQRRLQHQKQAA